MSAENTIQQRGTSPECFRSEWKITAWHRQWGSLLVKIPHRESYLWSEKNLWAMWRLEVFWAEQTFNNNFQFSEKQARGSNRTSILDFQTDGLLRGMVSRVSWEGVQVAWTFFKETLKTSQQWERLMCLNRELRALTGTQKNKENARLLEKRAGNSRGPQGWCEGEKFFAGRKLEGPKTI